MIYILLNRIITLELKIGISKWWQPSDPEYIEASQYIKERKYHCALINNLQKLVIQCLFELNKLNIAATGKLISFYEVSLIYLLGYHMCIHIAKSLQTCCEAIQNAVWTYNLLQQKCLPLTLLLTGPKFCNVCFPCLRYSWALAVYLYLFISATIVVVCLMNNPFIIIIVYLPGFPSSPYWNWG